MKEAVSDSDHEETQEDQTSQLPIDRGWAWVILAASWVNQFLVNGTFRTFGILFPEIQRKFGASASTTALIPALNLIGFGFTTMLVQTVGLRYFSTRQTVIVGSLTLFICYVISAFSPVVELLIVFLGFVPGLATAFIFAPTTFLIGEYFDKRRGLALCISTTGGGMGLFAFSFLLRTCLDGYGLSGTLLITAAVCMHGLVSGGLQRPLNFYRRNITHNEDTTSIDIDPKCDRKKAVVNGDTTVKHAANINGDISVKNTDVINGDVAAINLREKAVSPLLTKHATPSLKRASKRIRTYSQNSQGSLIIKLSAAINKGEYWRYASNEFSASMLAIDTKGTEPKDSDKDKDKDTKEQASKQNVNRKLKSVISADALKRPVFLVCVPFGCLLAIASGLALVFIPPHAKDLGFSDKQASLLVTMISIADMVSVLMWGILADKRWLGGRSLVALAATVMGVTMFFTSLFTTFYSFVFFSVVYGLFGRVWFCMYPFILVEMLGIDDFKSALGIMLLCSTAINSLFMFIMGAMRDSFGSYVPCFQLMASALIAGAIGMLLLHFVERCEKTQPKQRGIVKEIEP